MKRSQIAWTVVISLLTTLGSIYAVGKLKSNSVASSVQEIGKVPFNYASFAGGDGVKGYPIDFTAAAQAATPAVVHIKTRISARTSTVSRRNPFADLFGDDFGDLFGGSPNMQQPEQRASGSGVLITSDGYIVTNNHVIENADEINVTLNNKKSYKAELIGTDPSSDLAVLKITASNLPYLVWGNSDDVKLGQWVLAIGYPWTLDVTVTAGIVSAKARSLGINAQKSQTPVESFIQTDAAVNQGNSGGALVDTDGKLIGINSAIASQTGSYAGYSYAIPVNIVKKIYGDLIKFGAVQRAYLGVSYVPDNASDEQMRKMNIRSGEGVYVSGVADDGAAKQSGIKEGDYIVAINETKVTTGSEMVEQVANFKPGDKITVTYKREGKEYKANVTLRNKSGNFEVVKGSAKEGMREKLGGELVEVDKAVARQYGVEGAVLVKVVGKGLLGTTRIQQDFAISSVDGKPVRTVDELVSVLGKSKGTVRLEGFYPGYESTYAYPLNLNAGGGQSNKDLQEP
ncbi:MAG: PDZ domain-containing protein [Bacteroidetes bacterium]|nr:MAG: PDZ domain-containing protein [Bacteroidota bacterium]